MELLTVLVSITLITLVSSQTVCPDGSQPSNCDLLEDPCLNNTCIRYPEAACMADPCNHCCPSFYHDRTGTKLKCNDESLRCVSCLDAFENTCGGPGLQTNVSLCKPDEVCGVIEGSFGIGTGIGTVNLFYRGCLAASLIDDGASSCYDNEKVAEILSDIVDGGTGIGGKACVCTEDACNNFDLDAYPNEDVPSCVVSGVWYNPGEFLNTSDCDVSFCDNTGEIACISKGAPCVFEDYYYENGESFTSGFGDCICNDGDISCTAGDQSNLLCYTNVSFPNNVFDVVGGIEVCEDDSECIVGSVVRLEVFPVTYYIRGCVKKELLQFSDCTTEKSDVSNLYETNENTARVMFCRCNTSFCNEVYPTEDPPPGDAACGTEYNHKNLIPMDECNVCMCYNGERICSNHACNGLKCFSYEQPLTEGVLMELTEVICPKGEVCAAFHTRFQAEQIARESFLLRCLKDEMKLVENDECITEVYTFIQLGLLPAGSPVTRLIVGELLLCNSTLCNTRETLERACNPVQTTIVAESSTKVKAVPSSTEREVTRGSVETSTNVEIVSSTSERELKITTAKGKLTKSPGEDCLTRENSPLAVGDTISFDGCNCTCRRDINKDPSLSCFCKIDVEIRFESDFSLVENTLEDFKREVINELAQTLGLDKTSIQVVKVLKGSIVVQATIISNSSDTRENLEETVNDGSFQINHEGTILTANSVTVRNPDNDDEEDDEETSDSRKPPFFYIIISLAAAIGAVFLIMMVCIIFSTEKEKKPSEKAHSYYSPPVELEPDEKLEAAVDSISNDYQRALPASEITADYHREINPFEMTTDYHRSIDPSEGAEEGEVDQADTAYVVPNSYDLQDDDNNSDRPESSDISMNPSGMTTDYHRSINPSETEVGEPPQTDTPYVIPLSSDASDDDNDDTSDCPEGSDSSLNPSEMTTNYHRSINPSETEMGETDPTGTGYVIPILSVVLDDDNTTSDVPDSKDNV